jgi:hypothetical protein
MHARTSKFSLKQDVARPADGQSQLGPFSRADHLRSATAGDGTHAYFTGGGRIQEQRDPY